MKLFFVGDCVITDYTKFKLPAEIDLKEYDYSICNLEAPIRCSSDIPWQKIGPNLGHKKEAVEKIAKAGFNVFLLANNHIMDYGESALKRTIDFCNEYNILHTGAGFGFEKIYRPLILKKGNERVGIINVGEAQFGVAKNKWIISGHAWCFHVDIIKMIKELRDDGMYVIVCCHAGLEEVEDPLPEWQELYHSFIDAGADTVIAAHPHIIQGIEKYQERYIYYSLGNFFFDNSNKTESWNTSMVLTIDTINNTHDIKYTKMVEEGVVLLKDDKIAEKVIRLSKRIADKDKLESIANQIADDMWRTRYRNFFMACYNNFKKLIVKKALYKLKLLSSIEVLNEDFILHNMQVESHRFVALRYLYRKNIRSNLKKE